MSSPVPPLQLASYLADPRFCANPYAAYRQLREQAPVYWSDHWHAWVRPPMPELMLRAQESAEQPEE